MVPGCDKPKHLWDEQNRFVVSLHLHDNIRMNGFAHDAVQRPWSAHHPIGGVARAARPTVCRAGAHCRRTLAQGQILRVLLLTLLFPYSVKESVHPFLLPPHGHFRYSLFTYIIYEINSIEAETSALWSLFFGFEAVSPGEFCLNDYGGKNL